MKNDRNTLKELQNSLENVRGNLHVLDVNVPVEKQMEFFRYAEGIRRDNVNDDAIDDYIRVLFSTESSHTDLKFALAFLATSGDVKAFRAIEEYNRTHSNDWAAMALLQAKIMLQSVFSDEKQIFISTGLGGKDDKLRFYAFFKSRARKHFSDFQKKLIEKEILYSLQNYQGILEEINIQENYFTLLFLINIQVNIKNMLDDAINECNQYGDFINKGFIITNVKVFSKEEIQNELSKRD